MAITWKDYLEKSKPADTDELMALDTTASANKRVKFSGIWDWIVDKMATAVMSKLETQNKPLIGAVNELNSNAETGMFVVDIKENEDMAKYIRFKNQYEHKPFVAITQMSEGSYWMYITVAVTDISNTDCFIRMHNIENKAYKNVRIGYAVIK